MINTIGTEYALHPLVEAKVRDAEKHKQTAEHLLWQRQSAIANNICPDCAGDLIKTSSPAHEFFFEGRNYISARCVKERTSLKCVNN